MKKKIAATALLVCLIFQIMTLPSLVLAGSSSVQVATSSSFQGSINQGNWFVRGVEYGNNSMVFGEQSTGDTRVVSKVRFENLKEFGFTECYTFEFVLRFTSVSDGAAFLITFGMDRPTSEIGAAPATSIAITREGDALFCGLLAHGSLDTVLAEPVAFSDNALGKDLTLTGTVGTDGTIRLAANGTQIADGTAGFATAGYFGFGQTGNTVTEITRAEMTASEYARPENTEAFVDFSGNEYNANEWYAQGMSGYFKPSSLAVQDEKLVFENVAEASFSTLHSYSNFELTFDVPDLQRTALFQEQTGELVKPVSSWIGVSMGAQAKDGGSADGIAGATVFYLDRDLSDDRKSAVKTRGVLMSYNTVLTIVELPAEHHFWDEDLAEQNGCMQLKFRMEDGVLTVWGKWESEEEYYQILQYDLSYTPLGLVQIWGMGHNETGGASILEGGGNPLDIMTGNFSIDNVKLTNLDAQKNVITVDFKTNIREKPADYNYVDRWSDEDLLSNILKKEN